MPRIPSSVFRSIKYEIQKHPRNFVCNFSSQPAFPTRERCFVLGIETSCDDTGCAIVDNKGKILGEALHSQQQVHLDFGGIIPPVAKKLHQEHIEKVVQDALKASHLNMDDIDAVAATVKPGLPLSLVVGMNYGKELCRKFAKPFIPVHHMEAHTLTIRMIQKVDFPFLVLLISGGHCLLAIAQAVDKYLLLGHSIDDAPGEALDKTARRLKLQNIPEFSKLSGGQAIEKASERGNLLAFAFPSPMSDYRNCDFSFAGLKNVVTRHILHEEAENEQIVRDTKCDIGDTIPTNTEKTRQLQLGLANEVESKSVKPLGIHIYSKLNWQPHINQVCKKLSRVSNLIWKLSDLVLRGIN
ncbi:tRNA N6-adenosine threonylcarbamoyltransferase, mitochondrial isoform X3 [Schistocerca nitens]|uniref:tRNA N6-adenosine threonylcarbamoyltransferase, mitochondrial isoform X3 n=1 Tax=Schistocerca nitens TaxID=7011 RepID=UPI00211925AE|nr:tRNA N6-adenosine threonylcarbamoyltransferase, mitochondrial isoform X3 [Schistocerca nitens]